MTNINRCPHMKVLKKEVVFNDKGLPISEITTEEFNDCYGKYCMAWDKKTKACKLISMGEIMFGPPSDE